MKKRTRIQLSLEKHALKTYGQMQSVNDQTWKRLEEDEIGYDCYLSPDSPGVTVADALYTIAHFRKRIDVISIRIDYCPERIY